jgi:hypothetical protein
MVAMAKVIVMAKFGPIFVLVNHFLDHQWNARRQGRPLCDKKKYAKEAKYGGVQFSTSGTSTTSIPSDSTKQN